MSRFSHQQVFVLVFWLTAFVGLTGATKAWAADPHLVIQGGTIFDPVAGKLWPDRDILIEGTMIKAIGTPQAPMAIPADARVIDAKGQFIIPGLIDAHVHLVHRLNFAHVTGDEVLPAFLAAGVTTVRDTGDEIVAQTLVARFAAAHPERSPRVFTASFLLDADPPIHRDIGLPIGDPSRVPAIVEDMVGWKVTTLKIYAGSGRAVGRKIIEEGHKHGFVVTGHLSRYSAQEAIDDGIDCLEHITSVFDFAIPPNVRNEAGHRATLDLGNPQATALIASLAKKKIMVDPTLTVFKNMLLLSDLEEVQKHADNDHMPARLRIYWDTYRTGQGLAPSTRDRRRTEFQKYQELTGLLYRAGVPLLAGTDSPEPYCPPGFALHQELELLVEAGLSPAAALQAATINNARALKQSHLLGSVEPGKLADLLILDADPTADIRNTRRIVSVVRDGAVHDPKTLLKAVPAR
jgi:imidazolonepropionase-like amidohydrolase